MLLAIPPQIPVERVEQLSERQRDVLALVGAGLRNEEIGRYLCRGYGTVATHCQDILDKVTQGMPAEQRLLCRRREVLVSLAVRAGLALPSDPRGSGPSPGFR